MGDLLKDQGYALSYFNGADISFAGKDDFFVSHGFSKVQGKKELLKRRPHAALSNWGVHDDDLFDVVREEFAANMKKGQPFFMAALTVDTHPPGGFESNFCKTFKPYGDGKNPMLNAVHCSDYLIGQLVKDLQSYGRDDVLIVIGSDHLQSASMSTVRKTLARHEPRRHNLLMVLGSSIPPSNIKREATSFDIAPHCFILDGV